MISSHNVTLKSPKTKPTRFNFNFLIQLMSILTLTCPSRLNTINKFFSSTYIFKPFTIYNDYVIYN